MTDTDTTIKCIDCEEEIEVDEYGDPVGDYQYWDDGIQCWGCYDSEYPSTAYHYDPEYGQVNHETGKIPMYYIYDHGQTDEYGETDMNAIEFTSGYVRTDGWRGYQTCQPVGDDWYNARSGWTTGDWGDSIARSKRDVNEWMEKVITGEKHPPCEVVIIFSPTSNVFSTSVGIWIHEKDEEKFTEYIGDTTEGL